MAEKQVSVFKMVFDEKGEHGHGSRGARKEAGRRPVRPIKASPHDRPIIHHIPSTRRAVLKMASAGLPTHMQFLNKTKHQKWCTSDGIARPMFGLFFEKLISCSSYAPMPPAVRHLLSARPPAAAARPPAAAFLFFNKSQL